MENGKVMNTGQSRKEKVLHNSFYEKYSVYRTELTSSYSLEAKNYSAETCRRHNDSAPQGLVTNTSTLKSQRSVLKMQSDAIRSIVCKIK